MTRSKLIYDACPMPEQLRKVPDTIIGGKTNLQVIDTAVSSYLQGLYDFGFGSDLESILQMDNIQHKLAQIYKERVLTITPFVSEIILDINERIKVLDSDVYQALVMRDSSLWNEKEYPLLFSLFACVDKGVPFEAVIGVSGDINRTLGGDIQIFYSPSRNTFYQDISALKKGVIHERRIVEGADIIMLLEHMGCGRRNQIILNEEEANDIPSLGLVFDHIEALQSEFGSADETLERLFQIQNLWRSYERIGPAVQTPDNGLYAGIVYKIAERIAIKNTTKNPKTLVPIVVYDKMTGNFISGLDKLDVLTDPIVLSHGGFTEEAIEVLVGQGKIFSLSEHKNEIDLIIDTVGHNTLSSRRTYVELQNNWYQVQEELMTITQMLWEGYRANSKQSRVFRRVVDQYLSHVLDNKMVESLSKSELETVSNRLIHQLFHVTAYAFHLDTFNQGNTPGHHAEDHLATGNHDLGTRRHLPLGQGFLEKPTASEMFTGYTVLHHSLPGEGDGFAIPVMIKCDTEKNTQEAISYPESRAALEDFRTFLNLWPYFLVGELIPFVVIKEHSGGISRLAKSIVLTFDDIAILLEREDIKLPMFVPALCSTNKVVLIPAREVLITGVKTGKNLNEFRNAIKIVADIHAPKEYQEAYKRANGQ